MLTPVEFGAVAKVDAPGHPTSPIWDHLPRELAAVPRWVVWRRSADGKKVPYSAKRHVACNVTRHGNGAALEQARAAFEQGQYSGVGFILNGDGIVAVDVDDCVTDGVISPEAEAFLDRLRATYVEISPSGRGLRAFGRATVNRNAKIPEASLLLEFFSSKSYVTVTGRRLDRYCSEGLCQLPLFDQLVGAKNALHRCNFPQEAQEAQVAQAPQATHPGGGGQHEFKDFRFPGPSIPATPGQRNRAVFHLARYLRGVMPEASESQLLAVVRVWHAKVFDAIDTKEFELSWADFVTAWRKVEQPWGSELSQIFMARTWRIPAWMRLPELGQVGDSLTNLCVALAEHYDPDPFYLTSRAAGEFAGCSHTHASSVLNAMVAYGVLRLESRGKLGKASEYRLGTERLQPFALAGPRV